MRRYLLAILLACPVWAQQAALMAITGATVVDGTGAPPAPAVVLLEGERIKAVGANLAIPPGARRIDAAGHTLIPGLFDLHTHIPYSAVSGWSGDWGKNLKAYLYCGVTTLADFGTYGETFEPVRRLVNDGVFASPRLHLAARITTPLGHGAEGGRGDLFSLQVLTPRDAVAAVRRALAYRPDAIKVFTDGWRYGMEPDMTSMEEDTLRAIVEAAHAQQVEVMTHTVTLEKAKIAARAGVDVIAHGVGNAQVDDELIALMKNNHVAYVSTLAVYEPRLSNTVPAMLRFVLEPTAYDQVTPIIQRRRGKVEQQRLRRWSFLTQNLKTLYGAGVRVAAGTDAGVTGTYHGISSLRELELMVEAGLSPLQAITAATGESAKAIHVEQERGFIAAGKLADLVLIEGSPHTHIADLRNIRRVFLGGVEVDRAALAAAIASAGPTPIPARALPPLLDDLEADAPRTRIGSLWVNSTDSGHDNTRMQFGVTLRAPGNHALSVLARMSWKSRPFARVHLPLTPGAVEPADLRDYAGVEFDARGDGSYRLIAVTRGVRDFRDFYAPFEAGAEWKTVRIPFASLIREQSSQPAPWSGNDVTMLQFEIARPAGASGWLELDNVRLFKP